VVDILLSACYVVKTMKKLLQEISQCDVCMPHLQLGPRPVLAAHTKSKIVIIGQAPGRVVHKSGVPWQDKSGNNLRGWLQVDEKTFYDARTIALVPMGFCYPGKGKSGDLPPRPECAPLWHETLFKKMKEIKLIILIGKYAQDYYLGEKTGKSLTDTVHNFEKYLPEYFVLPHPSPRNNIWQAKNKWFGKKVLPRLKSTVAKAMK